MAQKIFRFKIILRDILPQIWRRIEVKSNITFYQFHLELQEAMGWTNSHLHIFTFENLQIGDVSDMANEIGEPPQEDEMTATLDFFFSKINTQIDYTYDFGDNWKHTIMLEAIEDKKKGIRYPRCIDGARACPPEDCGSSSGYYELLEILSNPEHPEYKSMKIWSNNFDPEYFDKKKATKNMRHPIDPLEYEPLEYDNMHFEEDKGFQNNLKWNDIPADKQELILNNVYCTHCKKSVKMVQYSVVIEKGSEILKGKCSTCLNDVARLLD